VDGWCPGGCWITLAQCDLMETGVQASSGWMVCRWVLNHSGPMWSNGNRCSGIQWMDGAPVRAESLWPSVIRWKSVFSSNWKNIKNRRVHIMEPIFLPTYLPTYLCMKPMYELVLVSVFWIFFPIIKESPIPVFSKEEPEVLRKNQ
jgi:hypothetical protein